MRDLNIIIVGAGIGGLQTALALANDGHRITLLESAKAFEEVGAGIRIPPNSLKLSNSWGVDFSSIATIPSLGNRFLDWKGKVLLSVSYHDMQAKYGAPYYFVHRADLVRLLADTAQRNARIDIRMGCRVSSYDLDFPSVTTATGDVLRADIIVCADGIKSAVRDTINRRPIPPQDTGDVAYRILVPAKLMLDDPEMAHLVHNAWAMHWLGPEGHAVGYPLRGGELYNIIIDVTHSSDRGEALPDEGQVWKSARSNEELVERFQGWCPEVQKLCAMTGEYLKWKLADFDQLDHWVSESGKACLLGDACHPMMPYMAQGAAQATEDAAALAAAIRGSDSIPTALSTYERTRKPRSTYVARNTRVLQEWLHLHDGQYRDERDRMMAEDAESNPIFWGWGKRKDWLFRYDASKLDGETMGIPSLPPMPPDASRVYADQRTHLRTGSRLSSQLQHLRLRRLCCDSPWRTEHARQYATTLSTRDERSNTYGSITTRSPQTTSIEELLAELKNASRSDQSSLEASGSSLLGLFLTPTYAQHALDPGLPLRALEGLNGSRKSLRDLKSIVAVVDRIPDGVPASTRWMRGGEGIAYTYQRSLDPKQEELLSERTLQDSSTRSSKQLSQPKAGTLVFRLSANPDLESYDADLTIPLAQTTFSTGRVSTMISATYKSDPAQDNILTTPEAVVSLESQFMPLVFDASVHGGCRARMNIPLKPLTPLRRVEHCMGNIIRSVSSQTSDVSGTPAEATSSPEELSTAGPQPASTELESAIQSFFDMNELSPHAVQVWALILPAEVTQPDRRGRRFGHLDQRFLTVVKSQSRPLSSADVDDTLRKLILHCGARLCRVLSGGGGWGKKAGLLSLDPESGYGARSTRQSDLYTEPQIFSSIEDVEQSKDSALGNIVKEGEHVMFLLGLPPPSQESSSGGQTETPEAQPYGSDNSRHQTRRLLFGCLPSSIDDIPEPRANSNDASRGQTNEIVHQQDTFGILSEGGLAFTSSPNEKMNHTWANQTKMDVPFARIDYMRAANFPGKQVTDEKARDEQDGFDTSTKSEVLVNKKFEKLKFVNVTGKSTGSSLLREGRNHAQKISQQLKNENANGFDLEDFVRRNTRTLDPHEFSEKVSHDR